MSVLLLSKKDFENLSTTMVDKAEEFIALFEPLDEYREKRKDMDFNIKMPFKEKAEFFCRSFVEHLYYANMFCYMYQYKDPQGINLEDVLDFESGNVLGFTEFKSLFGLVLYNIIANDGNSFCDYRYKKIAEEIYMYIKMNTNFLNNNSKKI